MCIATHSCNEVTRKSLAGLAVTRKTMEKPCFLLQDLGLAEVVQQYEQEVDMNTRHRRTRPHRETARGLGQYP